MGKQNMYEHTIRIPLILAGPGIPNGKRSNALCYLRDLYPTICDLVGIEIPLEVEGKSLKPLLLGQKDGLYTEVYGYFRNKQRMVRNDRFKLIHYPHLERYQLFDLSEDPKELKDLSEDSAHKATLARLRGKLKEWFRDRQER